MHLTPRLVCWSGDNTCLLPLDESCLRLLIRASMFFKLKPHLEPSTPKECTRLDSSLKPHCCAPLTMAQRFEIEVPTSKIDSIRQKMENFPWDSFVSASDDWSLGPPSEYMKRLCHYWIHNYKWSDRQARMNKYNHYYIFIDNLKIRFVVELGSGKDPTPLLLLHGWPYYFHSFHGMIDRLAHPERFGGREEDVFTVIVPSMPGYDLSQSATRPIGPRKIAQLYNNLMANILGFTNYIAHGRDWGSYVSEMMALHYRKHVFGIHLTMISVRHHGAAPKSGKVPQDASAEERLFVEDEMKKWEKQSSYARLQSYKPMKLAYGMADSPVGIAAWIVEAFHAWSDLKQDSFDEIFSMDDLLDEIMLYLITDSFNTASWLYVGEYEEASNELEAGQRIETPTAILTLPDPVFPMLPRSIAKRSHNVVCYTIATKGSHFPFYEVSEALLEDIV